MFMIIMILIGGCSLSLIVLSEKWRVCRGNRRERTGNRIERTGNRIERTEETGEREQEAG
jgi:hypothetical protein